MGLESHSGVRRVREALEDLGFEPGIVELDRTARSAAEAADALGVRVEQIVKSLVFRGRETGSPVLVLAGGANRVDEARISDLVSSRSRWPTPPTSARRPFHRRRAAGPRERPVALVDEDHARGRGLGRRGTHSGGLRDEAGRCW